MRTFEISLSLQVTFWSIERPCQDKATSAKIIDDVATFNRPRLFAMPTDINCLSTLVATGYIVLLTNQWITFNVVLPPSSLVEDPKNCSPAS